MKKVLIVTLMLLAALVVTTSFVDPDKSTTETVITVAMEATASQTVALPPSPGQTCLVAARSAYSACCNEYSNDVQWEECHGYHQDSACLDRGERAAEDCFEQIYNYDLNCWFNWSVIHCT